MRRPRLLPVRRFFSRGLGAAVPLACALLLLTASVEWHGDAAAHLPLPSLAVDTGEGSVFACADDHGTRSHVEPAHAVEREHCAACLHRVQRIGDTVAGLAVAGSGDRSGSLPALRPAPRPTPVLDHAPSRGPPAA